MAKIIEITQLAERVAELQKGRGERTMSLLRRIEALEATSSVPDEIWLIGVSSNGSSECGGGQVINKGLFRNAMAKETQHHNHFILLSNHHG